MEYEKALTQLTINRNENRVNEMLRRVDAAASGCMQLHVVWDTARLTKVLFEFGFHNSEC
jgi:hypothetical protein